ncbi:variable large family protein [Borrelia persica]|uniref:variable large family protein n=1 Tax=Borrelia persica TaxID=44448 RepID=UPI0004B5ECE1|nr:variable large family protein [Borrelia persica]
MMMMGIMGCNSGLVSEKEGLEKRNSFLDSLVKIGQGFQEIFGVFGNVIGNVFGFNVVKYDDQRSKVGEHFKKIENELITTKNKLNELSSKISEAKNADGSTIKVMEDVIKGTNDFFEQLVASLTKLAVVTNVSVPLGDVNTAGAAVGADEKDVNTVIESVKTIIDLAEKSGIKINAGNAGAKVTGGGATAGAALVGKNNAQADQGAAAKLVSEVSKADPWAMIDKIKNAKIPSDASTVANDNNASGALATKLPSAANQNGAVTNADLAAAVALKAMTKTGKFSANNANEESDAVKAAASNAVNKVLGILDVIIRKTVSNNLEKVREAIKGIKYSEIDVTEASQSDIMQSVITK